MITYYDIGLNLFSRSFPDKEKIIYDAQQAGVACILTGSDAEENEKVHAFVKTHPCWGTAGIHPHEADHATDDDVARIEEILLSNPKMVAVGECGLDYDRMYSSKENQLLRFRQLIALAEKIRRPLFLHERDAANDFISCFDGHEEICRRSVVHCYTGDRTTLKTLLAMGFYIGITGWIADDRRADALRDAAPLIPLSRVMLETDAPYLTPRGIKGLGRTNVPQNIVHVGRILAKYMGVTESDLVRAARENTKEFFHL